MRLEWRDEDQIRELEQKSPVKEDFMRKTVSTLAAELKKRGYNLDAAFNYFDTSGNNVIIYREFKTQANNLLPRDMDEKDSHFLFRQIAHNHEYISHEDFNRHFSTF